MSDQPRLLRQAPWLSALLLGLTTLSGAALVWLLFGASTLDPPPSFGLRPRSGWHGRLVATINAHQSRDFSNAKGQRYRWLVKPGSDGPWFDLEVLPIRVRRYQDLGVQSIQRLRQQSVSPANAVSYLLDGPHQLALIRAGDHYSLQTCVVPGRQAAAQSQSQAPGVRSLSDLLDVPPQGLPARARVVLGLMPPRRWQCILVTLTPTVADAANPKVQLLQAWRHLIPDLPLPPRQQSADPKR